jgi:hypothetical protein
MESNDRSVNPTFSPFINAHLAYIIINAIYLDCITAILVVTIRVSFSIGADGSNWAF